ncbi:MAG: HlyD family efflux transporter periplasmic adaptor subunit [Pirellulales bacterium]
MSITTREDQQHAAKFAAVLRDDSGSAAALPPVRRRRRIPRWLLVIGVLLAAAVLVATTVGSRLISDPAATGAYLTEKARKADLVISITEDGTLESSHNTDIKCEVQGGSTILWIVPDGTDVKKGDELVRLDSAGIQEKIDLQKITYEKAKALMIEAEKNFETAKISVQEYIEGTFVQQLQTLKVQATVAKENLESARNTLQFTNRMHRKGYVTTLQRDAQAFAVQRAALDLQVAETAITVLEKFTKPKTMVGLESARDSAEAKMASEKAAFELEQDRLRKLEVELEKCIITAPADGMVVYNNQEQERRSSSPSSMVEEGALMRERQTIIRLPDLSHMQVKCTVHESKIDSLRRGMRARIKVQDRDFQGIVVTVANQPEPSNWFAGNVKEYAAIVAIESDPAGLRPGMTTAVEILVDNLKDVLSIPVQSLIEQKRKFFCWVNGPTGIEKREITVGLGNNTRVQVLSGIQDGDAVLLNPRESVAEARDEARGDETINVKERFGGDKPAPLPSLGASQGGPGGEERGEGRPKQGGRGFDLMAADKDGDKKISLDEAPDRMKDAFGQMDTNGDGFIDAKEAAELRRRMQQMRQGGGQGGPGGPPAPASQ